MNQQDSISGGFRSSHDHGNCKALLALRIIQGRCKLLTCAP
jgi:hypothetical protein